MKDNSNSRRRSFLGSILAATIGGGILTMLLKPKTAQARGTDRLSLTDLQAQFDSLVNQVVPPGTVIDWWQFDDEPVPVGYAVCDGQVVNGFQTPDLTERFVRGGATVESIGSEGGNATTSVTLPPRSVAVDVPAHDHVAFSFNPISNVYASGEGYTLAPPGSPPGLQPGSATGGYRAMGIFQSPVVANTSSVGPVAAPGSTTSDPSVEVSIVPSFTTLLKLVKLP